MSANGSSKQTQQAPNYQDYFREKYYRALGEIWAKEEETEKLKTALAAQKKSIAKLHHHIAAQQKQVDKYC